MKPGLNKLTEQQAIAAWNRIGYYENDDYSDWYEDCGENREFTFGAQFTEDEKDTLEDRGQYAIAMNQTRKAVNGIAGLMSANQPKLQAIPAGGYDNNKSTIATKLNDWVWGNSGGTQMFRRAIKMAVRDNIGYFHVIWTTDRKCKFVVLGYDEVIVDPKSKDPLFRDAEYQYIVKWIPVPKAKALYNLKDGDLVMEVPTFSITNESGGETTLNPNKIFSADKMYVKVYEGYKKEYIRQPDTTVRTRIVKETLIGYNHLYREELPAEITEYPIIPVYSEDTDNPYKRGEVHFLKGLQRFINKTHGVALLNAQLMSNPKVFVRQNDIPAGDKSAFEDNYAKPGSVSVLTQTAENPIIINGQPLNQAFFTLYQDAKNEFEKATIPRDVLGYSDSAGKYTPDRILDIREAVLDSLKHLAGNIESAVAQMGKVVLQFCKAYLSETETIKIVDADKRVEYLTVNEAVDIDLTDHQSVARYMQYRVNQGMHPAEVEEILMQAKSDQAFLKDLAYVMNDVHSLDVDLFVVPGSYAPSFEMANLRLTMELFAQGIVDGQAVLEHAPVDDREALIERMNIQAQQSQQLEQMEEYIEEIEKKLEQANKKLLDNNIAMVVTEERARQDKAYNDIRTHARVAKERVNAEVKRIVNEAKRAVEVPDTSDQDRGREISPDDELIMRIVGGE